MRNSIYDLVFRIETNRITREDALLEIEAAVRDVDKALGVNLLVSAEITCNYQTYEKLRQAACLVRVAMNELYEQVQALSEVKGA